MNTTGEWTVEHDNMIYADGVFVTLIKDDGDRNRVVQMHNAAIATAFRAGASKLREQLAALKETQSKEFTDMQQQLAAEREKLQTWLNSFCFESLEVATEELDERQRTINNLQEQLTDERENL